MKRTANVCIQFLKNKHLRTIKNILKDFGEKCSRIQVKEHGHHWYDDSDVKW